MRTLLCIILLIWVTPGYLFAQCGDPKSIIDLLGNETYFCESTEPVVIDNRSDTYAPNLSCLDYMVLDWGDGKRDTLTATDFADKSHVYFFVDSIACLLPINGKKFTISLTVIYLNGLDHTATTEVTVLPLPRAYCSASPMAICLDPTATVQFNGSQSCHELSYAWDFGDPASGAANTSTIANPSHTFSMPGDHIVRLIVENDCGKDTCYTVVKATLAVVPSGMILPTEICIPDTVQLNNTSLYSISQVWDILGPSGGYTFIQGTANSKNPLIRITKAGTYTVRLTATGACDTKTITVGTIIARDLPQVSLSGDTTGCLPNYKLNMSGQLINSGNSTNLVYLWSFPGGVPASATTSTPQPPVVNYPNDGAYLVTLIARNECGDDTASLALYIAGVAQAGATFSQTPPGDCGPYTVMFTNTSIGSGGNYDWKVNPTSGWAFVNGTTKSDANPNIQFTAPGNYTVTLNLPSALCGGVTTWSQMFSVKTKPGASLPDTVQSCVPADVALNPGFSDGGFPGILPLWTAPGADPSTSNQTTPPVLFHYDLPGNYTITFTASNDCGDTTLQVAVLLAERSADAQFSGMPADSCGPFTAVFSNLSSGDGAGNIFWNVVPIPGSGATANGFSFANGTGPLSDVTNILFEKKGDYAVSLHFAGPVCGLDSTWTQLVSVKTKPFVTLDTVPDDCAPKSITPAGFSFDDGGDPATTHIWTATGSTLPSSTNILPPPAFPFDAPGFYALVFEASNGCGDTLIVDSFQLREKLPILFAPHPDSICKNSPPIPLSPNQSGMFVPAVPYVNAANEFDSKLAAAGWNVFEYHVGSDNCLVTLTDSIYVIDLPVDAGANLTVCDTLGGTTLSGTPVTGGLWSGPGVANMVIGNVVFADAGYGVHTIYHTLTQQDYNCVFRDSMLLTINPKPVSVPGGPQRGCMNQITVFENHSTGWDTLAWYYEGLPNPGTPDSTHVFTMTGVFPVTLIVNNAWCADTATIHIEIVPPPVMAFSLDPVEICPQDGVWLTNGSTGTGITGFIWDFGNSTGYTGFEPGDSIYYQPGIENTTYTITLTALGVCPDAVLSQQVLVHPYPHLYLTPSLDLTCSGDTLSFSVATTGGSISNLVFTTGDTTTYGLPLPDLQFFTPDSFPIFITAIISGENQCGSTMDTAIITIVPNEAEAFMNFNVPVICVGDTLYISSGATPVGANVSYDFGDQTTSTEQHPKKVYQQAGTYNITQYAQTICGYHFIQREIRVNPAPPVGFAHDPYACVGDSMRFWLTVDSTGRTYSWDFGPGSTSTALRPKVSFPAGGQFPVTLTITLDTSGCDASQTQVVEIKTNPIANFTPSDTIACGELHTTVTVVPGGGQFFDWTASNGNTSASNPASFIFSDSGLYEIRLYIEDIWGCHDDTTLRVFHVLPEPVSDFEMDKQWACGFPATVQLTKTASADAIDFNWLFADGTTSILNNPKKTFTTSGNFDITLIVKNSYGCADTSVKTFRVFIPPVADWKIDDPTPCQFEPLGLVNLSQHANHWFWTFNHTDTSSSEKPGYAFQQAGVFPIRLIAALDSFCFDTLERLAAVTVFPAPEAGFIAIDSMPNGYPKGLVYIFSTAKGADLFDYTFGNGQSSTLENPVVHYGNNGMYTIVQTVTNDWGCTDTASLSITLEKFGGLYVPDAFAPNAEGGGDYAFFMPKGRGLAKYRVRVYSPTGKLVFESQELLNGSPATPWDGNDLNGKPCQQGAYVWLIEAEYETGPSREDSLGAGSYEIRESGSVTLIR